MHLHRDTRDQPFVDPVAEVAASRRAEDLHERHDARHDRRRAGRVAAVFGEIERKVRHRRHDDEQGERVSERDHPEATCAQRLLGGEMAPASPLGVGGGVGLSRREAVHRFTRVSGRRPVIPAAHHAALESTPPTTRTVLANRSVWNPHTMIGAANPPSANPIVCIDSARARRFSNHATVAAEMVRKPTRLMPIASSSIARRNWARPSITATAMKPAALTIAPARITEPTPRRWISRPCTGPMRAVSPWPRRRPRGRSSTSRIDLGVPRRDSRTPGPTPSIGATTRRIGTDDLPSCVPTPSRGVGGGSAIRDRALVVVETQNRCLRSSEVPPAVQRPPLKVCGQLRDQLVGKPRSTDELAGSGQRVVIAWGLV